MWEKEDKEKSEEADQYPNEEPLVTRTTEYYPYEEPSPYKWACPECEFHMTHNSDTPHVPFGYRFMKDSEVQELKKREYYFPKENKYQAGDEGRYEDKGYSEDAFDCHACGFPDMEKPEEKLKRDMWHMAVRVRKAEATLGTERLIRSLQKATSKRQQKKLYKKINKRRSKLTEAYQKRKLLTEERQRENKEKRRKTGNQKPGNQKRKHYDSGTTSTSSTTENEDKMKKKTKKREEPTSSEIDDELDLKYQQATDSLIIEVLIWKVTAQQETKDENQIVTISSSESEDSDEEGRTNETRCRCTITHKTKQQLINCLSRKDNEEDFDSWENFITELGKAVSREKISKKQLATAFRVGAQQLGERKPQDYPSHQGEALRPEAQECHQGNFYKEALQQAKQAGPPKFTYIFNEEKDSWVKYLPNHQDVINSITKQVDKTAERESIKAKIRTIKSLTLAFEETTAREEIARKGYARGRNIRSFEAGEKVGRMVMKTMNKWKEEKKQYEARCAEARCETKETIDKKKGKETPGPNDRCSFCRKVPDSRLKQCSRCKKVLYCNSMCQRQAWRHHRMVCHPTKAHWPV